MLEWARLANAQQQTAAGLEVLPFDPHPGQVKALARIDAAMAEGCRRIVLRAPRRWGKDRMCTDLALKLAMAAAEGDRPPWLAPKVVVWFVDPSYPLGEQLWEERKRAVPAAWMAGTPNESKRQMWLKSDVFVATRTAERPEMLAAADVDIVVISDADRMRLDKVLKSLRPALQNKDRLRLLLINGTPYAQGEFKHQCALGDDPAVPGVCGLFYAQWKAFERGGGIEVEPHEDGNPHVDASEVQQAVDEEGLSRWVCQEYFGEFPSDEAALFPNPAAHAADPPEEPTLPIVIGWDPAKWQDYSVAMAMDAQGRSLAMERLRTVDYVEQAARVLGMAQRLGASVLVVESNGPGEPIYDMLVHKAAEMGLRLRIEAFATTALSKQQIIEALKVGYDARTVTLLADPVVVAEFNVFEPQRLASGRIRYGHPEGGHDDCVMASAFAYWGVMSLAAAKAQHWQLLGENTAQEADDDGGDGAGRRKWDGGLAAASRSTSFRPERSWRQ